MSTHPEADHESRHLREVVEEIDRQRVAMLQVIDDADAGVAALREYFWDALRDMDGAEKNAIRGMVMTDVATTENSERLLDHLDRARQSPYFARIDFRRDDRTDAEACYIGIRGLRRAGSAIVHDWRAPLSSMFYDHEQGQAAYRSPEGLVAGEIELKRQFVIRDGRMEAMLDSSVSIDDDILKRELSSHGDERMSNIVATIQREQNAIIRNEDADVLLIQGAAGSGKTSIALHRVAYMLYRFQTTISPRDMMILSPNQVFGDYIANVLPELGEETIPEMEFERLAGLVLGPKVRYQHLHEQIESLLTTPDEALRRRIREKSSVSFYEELRDHLENLDRTAFHPHDLRVSTIVMPTDEIARRLHVYSSGTSMTLKEKVSKLTTTVLGSLKHQAQGARIPWRPVWTTEVRRAIADMFPTASAEGVYRNFLAERGTPELFHKLPRNTYEYSDLFPLAFTALHVDKRVLPKPAKHVLVDEMQDYTPVHYAVLSKLYPCRMTILGDAHQAVNPDGSSTMDAISRVFPDAQKVTLGRSYRSTIEIARFAQRIAPNPDLIPFERHGRAPAIHEVADHDAQLATILRLLRQGHGEHQGVGVLCRTAAHAQQLFDTLSGHENVHLIDHTSDGFAEGVVVTTSHMAKGLEFDHVILANASQREYGDDIGRRMLYVACTRATNRLDVVSIGSPAGWLPVDEQAGTSAS